MQGEALGSTATAHTQQSTTHPQKMQLHPHNPRASVSPPVSRSSNATHPSRNTAQHLQEKAKRAAQACLRGSGHTPAVHSSCAAGSSTENHTVWAAAPSPAQRGDKMQKALEQRAAFSWKCSYFATSTLCNPPSSRSVPFAWCPIAPLCSHSCCEV